MSDPALEIARQAVRYYRARYRSIEACARHARNLGCEPVRASQRAMAKEHLTLMNLCRDALEKRGKHP